MHGVKKSISHVNVNWKFSRHINHCNYSAAACLFLLRLRHVGALSLFLPHFFNDLFANIFRSQRTAALPFDVVLLDGVFGFLAAFTVHFEEAAEFFGYVFFAFPAQDFSASAFPFPLS